MSILTFVLLYGLGYLVSGLVSIYCIVLYGFHLGVEVDFIEEVPYAATLFADRTCFWVWELPRWVTIPLHVLTWPIYIPIAVFYAVRLLKEESDTTHKEEA